MEESSREKVVHRSYEGQNGEIQAGKSRSSGL